MESTKADGAFEVGPLLTGKTPWADVKEPVLNVLLKDQGYNPFRKSLLTVSRVPPQTIFMGKVER